MTSDRAERHVMVPVELGGERRAAIAEIVETVARDGLPGPRDIDVALDAIGCVLTDGAPPARPPIQQEPVAWTIGGCFYKTLEEAHRHWDGDIRPLFAHPLPAQESGREQCHKLDTPQQVFFYEQDFYVLSNFSAFTLEWNGWRFDTSEAAYHWEKFAHMNEVGIPGPTQHECDICYNIRRATSAHAAFKIAEANKPSRRPDWDDVKVDVMRDIIRAKADQHEYVRRKLLATGDRELIEDSWRDDFWGWGPNRDGQNMLGKLWMEVRSELRSPLPKAPEASE